jgi:signal transduction histidine kinase/DNA-binding NarL/FixJ family response regulator
MIVAPIQHEQDASTQDPYSSLQQDRPPTSALKIGLILACAATLAAALLLGMRITTGGHEALLDPLIALDLLGLIAALLLCIRHLRDEQPALLDAREEIDTLARARQTAEAANEAKSRYLASVSHEIRSPLNAIYGYAQLFERGDGPNVREAARVIQRSAEHLTHLVEGLLDISQLESGVLRVRTEELHLAPFMDQIVSMMRPGAISKGLAFHYEPPARMPDFVRLDSGRFRQVLINLLSNAIKFTEHGSVTLNLSYSGQIATFEVRDTGPGIPAEDHERIFERFERGGAASPAASGSGARVKPGAGLGLAIARTIVEILGGRLELESEVGVGTCFRIHMMLSEIAGRVVTHVPTRKLLGYEGRRRAVLLVEDDPDQRFFMEQLISSLGFQIQCASSGEAAIEGIDGLSLDLAILDISLPGMSGWETATKLRERFGEGLQILMLSANSNELHRPATNAPTHDRFLVKPVEFDTLTETIAELLGLIWEWDERQTEPRPLPPVAADTAHSGAQKTAGSSPAEGIEPHLVRLQEFLRIGYVRGIEAEIRALEESAPDAGDLVPRLYDCLDRYDLAGMARIVSERT